MRRNELSEFELETEGFRIKLKKGGDTVITRPRPIMRRMPARDGVPAAAGPAAPSAAAPGAKPPGREITLADGGDILFVGIAGGQRLTSRRGRR